MKKLHEEIFSYLCEQSAALLRRVYPGNQSPRFFAGPCIDDSAHMDVLHLLGLLRELGVTELNGQDTECLQLEILRRVKGKKVNTFYSFRLAETLLQRGSWEENPLLAPLSETERKEIFEAVDSTEIFQETEDGGALPHHPNNYWGVLGRCEIDRKRLGILEDERILRTCITRLEDLLFSNALGFLDDSHEGCGRYDIYSFDIHLFVEPLFEYLDADKLKGNLQRHTELMERLIHENGASAVWGRSTGSLSVLMAMEWMAMALERDLASDRARSLGLIAHSFHAFQGWFDEGLVTAHRHRSPFHYRGTHRYLQLSSDLLIKLAYVVSALRSCPDQELQAETDPERLFPAQDHWQPFDDRPCGVWTYRDRDVSFQLPLSTAGGWGGHDYAPFPAAPGLLEGPVQESWPSGLPRIFYQGNTWLPIQIPDSVEHSAGRLLLRWSKLDVLGEGEDRLPADLSMQYRVQEGWIELELKLQLEQAVEAVAWQLPETERSLQVDCESQPEAIFRRIPVDGIKEWRSFWGPLKQLSQWELQDVQQLSYRLRFRPQLRVRQLPGDHDYNRALFGAMDPEQVLVEARSQGRPITEMDPQIMSAGCDLLHVGWPEHWFSSHNQDPEEFETRLYEFIAALEKVPAKIVWTMHNRIPHSWDPEQGQRLYQAMARVVDGAIHHSECGMQRMRAELPFRKDAKHVVIPHGHFGEGMQVADSREALETRYGLSPCRIRWGVFGRAQPNKQIDVILEAFLASDREDIQLVTDAQPEDFDPCGDERLILLPREGWLMRDEIARRAHLSDAMVSAHLPENYLTTGVFADAVGVGQPMLCPRWDFLEEMMGDAAWYHENTRESLTACFNRLQPEDISAARLHSRKLQETYAWSRLAGRTQDFYRELSPSRGWA